MVNVTEDDAQSSGVGNLIKSNTVMLIFFHSMRQGKISSSLYSAKLFQFPNCTKGADPPPPEKKKKLLLDKKSQMYLLLQFCQYDSLSLKSLNLSCKICYDLSILLTFRYKKLSSIYSCI